ncbi:DEAD/DEAH box RNA helicase [Planoprotostelium fungivorum]|uniref:DEAD/DEAH box RNA helicase n=1 Tax=Planoprotostelium fungivorum TaxID=1890364 RepID=A0A2P6NQG5_9EUKA|nr:DEAD/DEAH box RNA helicase [Planoprotostelium fungivorum]
MIVFVHTVPILWEGFNLKFSLSFFLPFKFISQSRDNRTAASLETLHTLDTEMVIKRRKEESDSDNSDSEKESGHSSSSDSSSDERSKSKSKKPSAKKQKIEEEEKPSKKSDKDIKDVKKDKKETKTDKAPLSSDKSAVTNYRISEATVLALASRGVTTLFPIQTAAYDPIFDGKDVIGRAKTGTGKTFAFAVPTVERLLADFQPAKSKQPYVIVMAPTRELAKQIASDFESLSKKITVECIYGGVPMDVQKQNLWKGVHVLVGTPGRIKDHLNRQTLDLKSIKVVILDEADEMLRVGFKEDVDEILSHIPQEKDRQTLLFSATLPPWVKAITDQQMKKDKTTIDLVQTQKTKVADTITYYAVPLVGNYSEVLEKLHSVYAPEGGRTIVFTKTKATAAALAGEANLKGKAMPIHGDVAQAQREQTLADFKASRFSTLVATNVAARGLDIPKVDLVIQIGLPENFSDFIHRSGRTGRAGRQGVCILAHAHSDTSKVHQLAKQTGIFFKAVTAPTEKDKKNVEMEKAKIAIRNVDPNMAKDFVTAAKDLLKEEENAPSYIMKGAETLLSRALAYIAGYAQEQLKKSIICYGENQAEYTTLKYNKPTDSYEAVEADIQRMGVVAGLIIWSERESLVDVPLEDARRVLQENSTLSIAKFVPSHMQSQIVKRGGGDRKGRGGDRDKKKGRGGKGGYGGNAAYGGGGGGYGGGSGGYGGGDGGYGGGSGGYGGGYGGGSGSYGGGSGSYGNRAYGGGNKRQSNIGGNY